MNLAKKGIQKCIIITFVLGILLFCSTAVAHGAMTATGEVTDSDGVNIRSTYSTSGSIVGAIPSGGKVTITKEKFTSESSTAENTRWYYVSGSYGKGWVRTDLLNVTYKKYEGKVKDTLNVRKRPLISSKEGDVVATLAAGDSVTVFIPVVSYSNDEWYKIVYKGYYRYVRAPYVELEETVATVNTDFEKEVAAFPSSYRSYLTDLHEKYPTWHFKAAQMSYTWEDALDEQCSSYKINTIPSSFKDGYKAVDEGTYDFKNHTYVGLDGSGWVAASRKAVAYYMDPRNWLDEINVFMFESLVYDPSTQSENMVKDILSDTAIPSKYASSYMKGGEAYNISPVYLAAKSRIELGTSDYMVSGTKFTYNGKTYEGYYNAYNIGASDSASGDAAKKGLVYAASGSSYLRPWTTLDKAIRGGAKFIAEDFIGNNQHTLYYERFNVANGLTEIGTHQYMTNTFAPATQANITYWSYEESGMLDTPFTFEIPVYKSMTSSKASAPGTGSNNNFLDSLKIYDGDTKKTLDKSFDRFAQSYKVKGTVKSKDITVKAVANDSAATVTVSGNSGLKSGENKITIKVKSPSGLTRKYYVTLTKEATVDPPVVKLSNDAGTGKITLTWDKENNGDEFKVYRSTSEDGKYTVLSTVTGYKFTDKSTETGKKYYYKVKAVGTSGVIGEATSKIVYRVCDLPAPKIKVGNQASDGKVKVSWKAVEGAKEYAIYRATSESGPYEKLYTKKGTSYINTGSATPGTKYYYKVKAIHEKSSANSAYSEPKVRVCDLPRPVVTVKNDAETGKVKVSWKAVEGAKEYAIYRATSENGTYEKMYTKKGTSYINTASATPGTKYYYKVKAIHKKSSANSAYSEPKVRVCDLPSPVVTIGNDAESGKVKLTWKAVEGAAKYEIYRSTSENGTYEKMYTQKSRTYINTASATAGTKYYYKVKAIHEKSSANSAFSKAKVRVCDLPRPVVSVGKDAETGKVKLTWKAVEGATKYEIYRATSKTGTYKKMYTQKSRTYVNTASVVKGKTYYYKVRALHEKSSATSAYSTVVTGVYTGK